MKAKTFNLTEKRVEALRYIAAHPGVYVCGIAEKGLEKLAEIDARIEAEKNSLDTVLARCVEAA